MDALLPDAVRLNAAAADAVNSTLAALQAGKHVFMEVSSLAVSSLQLRSRWSRGRTLHRPVSPMWLECQILHSLLLQRSRPATSVYQAHLP